MRTNFKKTLIIVVSLFIMTSVFSQQKKKVEPKSNDELKKTASLLMECFLLVKTECTVTLSNECNQVLGERITNLNRLLEAKINNNKNSIIAKLGNKEFEELNTQVKNNYDFVNKYQGEITPQQQAGLQVWIQFSKPEVEKLFILLNK